MENTNQAKPKAKVNKAIMFLTTLIVLLGFVLLVLGWLYYTEKQEAQETQNQLIAEKDSITENLKSIIIEYEILETDNESIRKKLEEEQVRAEKLYVELKQLRTVSYAKIKEYQRELGTLRAIMKDMVQEIDSLNTLNQKLIAENIKVRQEFSMSQKNVENLEQQKQQLSTTVAKGSVIRARDVFIKTTNSRGREVSRAKNVNKIQTCFIVSENPIAKAGNRFVYVRILGPDGFILAKSNTDLFDYEGEKIVFSARREVDYQNQDVEMCIFYDSNGELIGGTYQVNLFMDGYLVGYGEFALK
jgi:regulator of replication initiation timing